MNSDIHKTLSELWYRYWSTVNHGLEVEIMNEIDKVMEWAEVFDPELTQEECNAISEEQRRGAFSNFGVSYENNPEDA